MVNVDKKIETLNALKGQLVKIEDELESILDEEMYFDLCDNTGSIGAYIKLAIKSLKSVENE